MCSTLPGPSSTEGDGEGLAVVGGAPRLSGPDDPSVQADAVKRHSATTTRDLGVSLTLLG